MLEVGVDVGVHPDEVVALLVDVGLPTRLSVESLGPRHHPPYDLGVFRIVVPVGHVEGELVRDHEGPVLQRLCRQVVRVLREELRLQEPLFVELGHVFDALPEPIFLIDRTIDVLAAVVVDPEVHPVDQHDDPRDAVPLRRDVGLHRIRVRIRSLQRREHVVQLIERLRHLQIVRLEGIHPGRPYPLRSFVRGSLPVGEPPHLAGVEPGPLQVVVLRSQPHLVVEQFVFVVQDVDDLAQLAQVVYGLHIPARAEDVMQIAAGKVDGLPVPVIARRQQLPLDLDRHAHVFLCGRYDRHLRRPLGDMDFRPRFSHVAGEPQHLGHAFRHLLARARARDQGGEAQECHSQHHVLVQLRHVYTSLRVCPADASPWATPSAPIS